MISKAQYALFVIAITSLTLLANWHYQSQQTLPTTDMNCGFTQDFANFIQNNGYSTWQFDRPDLKCASYGGRATAKEKIKNIPVIFIHGNSDIGFGRGSTDGYASWQTGFTQLATFLAAQGYQKSEMYTTTYGPANPNLASQNYHSKKYVTQIRAFVQAVLAYTGAPLVNIIGHSMGVTIGRKVIKGGSATDHMEGNYNLGPSLKDKVKTFVGLAGANLGLNQCYASSALPTCGVNEGFYPGLFSYSGPSKYLADLNANGGPEATNVYTIWSKFDDLIQSECLVWGKVTCRITGQTAQVIKNSIDWNHFAVRDKTGPDLFKWL